MNHATLCAQSTATHATTKIGTLDDFMGPQTLRRQSRKRDRFSKRYATSGCTESPDSADALR